jgi:hypothetical protein
MLYGSIKHLRLNSVNANTNFTVPEGHILIGAMARNNALFNKNIQIRMGANSLGTVFCPASGDWNGVLFTTGLLLFTSDVIFEVYDGSWTSEDIDVILIMDDTLGI